MKAKIAVGRQMDVTGRRRIPDARSIAERRRTLELGEPEGLSVELSSSGFLARRIEHLRVMQGNPHKFESRREKITCFPHISWAIIYHATLTEVLTWRSSRARRRSRPDSPP